MWLSSQNTNYEISSLLINPNHLKYIIFESFIKTTMSLYFYLSWKRPYLSLMRIISSSPK